MSTDYLTCRRISFLDLFDGRLEPFGIHEEVIKGSTQYGSRCLVDERNHCVWVHGHDEVDYFSVYGENDAEMIFSAIEMCMDVHIQYCTDSYTPPKWWGYKDRSPTDSITGRTNDEDLAEFYVEIMRHVRGVSHNLKPGSIRLKWADIAKNLIAENPKLASLGSVTELMKATRRAYTHSHPIDQKKPRIPYEDLNDRLLESRQPRAAFHAAYYNFDDIETQSLNRRLNDVATVNDEPASHFKRNRYNFCDGLDELDDRPGVSSDELA